MKILIAIKSCRFHRLRGDHDVIRNTWGRDVKDADLRFFVGADSPTMTRGADDEVNIDCPDDYDSLPYKTREILRWSLAEGYDYTFLCDTDTYVNFNALMKSGFDQFDYAGKNSRASDEVIFYNAVDRWKNDHPIERCWPWMSGGFGYFVSRKAASIVVEHEPNIWAEDLWVGQILFPLALKGDIKVCGTTNFMTGCSWHFPQAAYDSQYDPKFGWLEKMYKERQ